MPTVTVESHLLVYNGLEANWITKNPILMLGEMAFVTDKYKIKMGDGQTPFNLLPYMENIADLSNYYTKAQTDNAISTAITDKANMVSGAISGNLASLNSSGDLVDSGKKATDFDAAGVGQAAADAALAEAKEYTDDAITDLGLGALATKNNVSESDLVPALSTKINNKADKVASATANNFAGLDANGNLIDSGKNASSFDALGAAATAESNAKAYADSKVASVFKLKGSVATIGDLPSTGNETGDVWYVQADSSEHFWDGSAWELLGLAIDLSAYSTTVQMNSAIATAKSEAISTAATDATTKANAAETNAKTYVDNMNISTTYATKSEVTTGLSGKVDKNGTDRLITQTEGDKLAGIATGATKVEGSENNGAIKVNGGELNVYTLPNTVLHSTDTLILDGGTVN